MPPDRPSIVRKPFWSRRTLAIISLFLAIAVLYRSLSVSEQKPNLAPLALPNFTCSPDDAVRRVAIIGLSLKHGFESKANGAQVLDLLAPLPLTTSITSPMAAIA